MHVNAHDTIIMEWQAVRKKDIRYYHHGEAQEVGVVTKYNSLNVHNGGHLCLQLSVSERFIKICDIFAGTFPLFRIIGPNCCIGLYFLRLRGSHKYIPTCTISLLLIVRFFRKNVVLYLILQLVLMFICLDNDKYTRTLRERA